MAQIEKLYRFMDRSQLNRRIVGTIIGLLLIGGIYIIGTGVWNTIGDNIARGQIQEEIQKVKDASPKEYVDFYSVNVDNAPVGDLPNLTLCRKLGHGTVKIDAVRTFIRYADGKELQVDARGFTASIEESITNTDCTTVPLRGQPNQVGTYSIFTDYCFNVEVHGETIKKCDNYASNKYQITDDIKQLKERLESLQEEYDRRLSNQSSAEATSTPLNAPLASNQQTQPPAQSNNGNVSTESGGGNTAGGSTGSTGNSNDNDTARTGGITIDLPLLPPITLFGN